MIDSLEATRDLSGQVNRDVRRAIYDIDESLIEAAGPSVVSINGVIASLAVTEFIAGVTKIRKPFRVLIYRGQLGIVTVNNDCPESDCYYCKKIRGQGKRANVERYLKLYDFD